MSLKSASGIAWERALNLSHDSEGNRIPHRPHFEGVRCKETRSYAPPPASDARESQDERMAREGRYQNAIAGLSLLEERVLRYQGKLAERIEHRQTVTAGQIEDWQREGYTLDPLSKRIEERAGLGPVECWDVVGYDLVETSKLSVPQIAEEMGISVGYVEKLVTSANKRMRAGTRK
jgi:hypothetical protein